jgi:hypothetical protein
MRACTSPTRSGPEGSSRNEFYSGRYQSLTFFSQNHLKFSNFAALLESPKLLLFSFDCAGSKLS